MDDLLGRLKASKVDAATLERAKIQARASVLRILSNNSGLARLLALCHATYGDWRKMFSSIDDLEKVTADDVQRVVRRYFVAANRTIVNTVLAPQGSQP